MKTPTIYRADYVDHSGNAGTWRGDVTKAIKAELKRRTA